MPDEDLRAELERLRAENEALKQSNKRAGSLSFRVSEKGAVSVYVQVSSLGHFLEECTQ
jgi:hypothetical protein